MILVTGAAGKTGQAVIRALVAKEEDVRALVHRPEQVGIVEELGAREVVVGDMRVPATVDRANQRVRAVYHICPNMNREEIPIGEAILAAARSACVEHFVCHSVLHPQTETMPHHWQKLRVEERIFESGLPFTILQPAAYMQNTLAHWGRIRAEGVFPVPYAVEARLSIVDLEDVAAAATTVLSEPGHAGATYELAGPEALSQTDMAAIMGRVLERPVLAEAMSLDVWEREARVSGLGDYQVKTLLKMFRYYDSFGFWGDPRVLGWLLGRPPAPFAAFVERIARERMAGD